MVEMTSSSSPGPSRTVTFQPTEELNQRERLAWDKVQDIFPGNESLESVLDFVRRQPLSMSDQDVVSRLIENIVQKNNAEEKNTVIALPDKESTPHAYDSMSHDGTSFSPRIKKDGIDQEQSDLQKAIQNSLNVSPKGLSLPYFPPNISLESVIRDPNRSAGLENSGNTCWLNSVLQLFYSLPAFRNLVIQCVPYQWQKVPIIGIPDEVKPEVEMFMLLRSLFARLRFTEISYISAADVNQSFNAIYQRSRPNDTTINNQHDAIEMLTLMMEWFENAFSAAMKYQLHPPVETCDENLVVADSTGVQKYDFAPPAYDSAPGSSSVIREAKTRDNSPDRPLRNSKSPVNKFLPMDEAMDTSENTTLDGCRLAPPPQKIARTENEPENETPVTPEAQAFVDELIARKEAIFASTSCPMTVSPNGEESNPRTQRNFPQYFNLQLSFKNLHDALEEITYETPSSGTDVRTLYEQLPAVLMVGLSRFVYDACATKLHDKFEFPKQVYMDRYLKCNEQRVLALREERNHLREQLSEQIAKHKGLTQYPHGKPEGETRLVDAFETVLEALTNSRTSEAPVSSAANRHFIGPLLPKAQTTTSDVSRWVQDQGKQFPHFDAPSFPELNGCIATLEKGIDKLKNEEDKYNTQEAALKNKIETIYDQEDLQKHGYHLHGIIVHSGEAGSGHYYTYQLKKSADGLEEWEQLNDCKTSVVPWSQVEADSFGTLNSHNSAYLLLYVRSDATWLMTDDTMTESESFSNLPLDLREQVNAHRVEWREALHRFREQKEHRPAVETEPQEETLRVPFSWCGESPQQEQGDENANPTGPFPSISDRMSEQTLVFRDDEMSEASRITGHLWNTIIRVTPDRFESKEKLLRHHLARFINLGGCDFLESLLGYPLQNLRSDADNDIERVYNNFINKCIAHAFEDGGLNPRSNFVLFASVIEQLHVAVLRYLIVRAISESAQCFALKEHALLEMSDFQIKAPDTFTKFEKVAYLLCCVYELCALSVYACLKSFEYFKQVSTYDPVKDLYSKENNYLSMVAARTARACNKILKNETNFLKDGGISFMNEESLQLCTVLPLLLQVKLLIDRILHAHDFDEDVGTRLSHNDRTVTVADILREVRNAVYMVQVWHRKNGWTPYENISISSTDFSDASITFPSTGLNISDVYGPLESILDLLCSLGPIKDHDDRSMYAVEIHKAMNSMDAGTENEIPDVLPKAVTGNIYHDLSEIRLHMTGYPSNKTASYITDFSADCQACITLDIHNPPYN